MNTNTDKNNNLTKYVLLVLSKYICPLSKCVPSFNLLGVTVPEKSVTKNFYVWKLERKKNEKIKGWIRAAAWFWYTWYIHPFSMCVPSFNLVGLTVPEKSVMKNFHVWKLERKKNEKGWIRAAAAWFQYTRYICPLSTSVLSFNLLSLTVPEKSVMKNFHVWKLERKKNEKGWIRAAAAWFQYTRYICPLSTSVLSFNLLGLTVPEKSAMKLLYPSDGSRGGLGGFKRTPSWA